MMICCRIWHQQCTPECCCVITVL